MALKMTPMIDVIFQLLIFLMCALHFRSLETKLETVLPANKEITKPLTGVNQVIITLTHNDRNPMMPTIKLDGISLTNYDELTKTLETISNSTREISVLIEPQKEIPTQCVVDAIDACNKAGMKPKLAK
ncbi:MAG: biopolymer transporter ExbD [Planctomycetes bacterium]|nr:biopolymer transporter ExbD [Planctomycetota bacterium]